MAEYIDRDLIEWYDCHFENHSCGNREHCSDCSHAECSHTQVMEIPTVDVIERSKIDKAIEEIEKLPSRGSVGMCRTVSLTEVLDALENIGE